MFVPGNTNQWQDVLGKVLLRDRGEYQLLLRFRTELTWRQDAQMFAEWQVVKCDSHVCVQCRLRRLLLNVTKDAFDAVLCGWGWEEIFLFVAITGEGITMKKRCYCSSVFLKWTNLCIRWSMCSLYILVYTHNYVAEHVPSIFKGVESCLVH